MSRTMTSPYAIATILLLTLGLVVTRFTRMQTATIAWRSASYGFTWQTPCYGLAAFFCVYAFLTSIGYIPFSQALSKWQFWVSAASILGMVVSVACISARLAWYPTDMRVGPGLAFAVVSVLVSLLIFSLAQLWFAADLVRALWRLRTAT